MLLRNDSLISDLVDLVELVTHTDLPLIYSYFVAVMLAVVPASFSSTRLDWQSCSRLPVKI